MAEEPPSFALFFEANHSGAIGHAFEAHAKKATLRPIRLHDLRHSAASLLLAAGENPKVVQELLGHSSVGITLDLYSHAIPSLRRDAVQRLGDAVFGKSGLA